MTVQQFLEPVLLSLKVAAVATTLVFLLGVAAAWRLSGLKFRGQTAVETAFMLPLVLPPTVVGFILLLALGRRSPIGRLAEWLLDRPIVFTWGAAAIASMVVAFPLVYQSLKVGFAAVSRELQDAARSMGASEWQVLLMITLPLSRRSLLAALLLGFARSLGEFGATLMVAGNIPGKTQTVPTAIYIAVENGRTGLALGYAASMVLVSFVLLLVVSRK